MSTVVVLAVFRNPMNTLQPLPGWVRYTFLRILPRLLLIKLRKVEKSNELKKLEKSLRYQRRRKAMGNIDAKPRPVNSLWSQEKMEEYWGNLGYAEEPVSITQLNEITSLSDLRQKYERPSGFFFTKRKSESSSSNFASTADSLNSVSSLSHQEAVSTRYSRHQHHHHHRQMTLEAALIHKTLKDVSDIIDYCQQQEKEELVC